jgi:hypothetical protein
MPSRIEHIVNLTLEACREPAQVMKKELIVLVSIKARRAVITALDGVKRNADRLDTQSSRHSASTNYPRISMTDRELASQ